jgi:hypothetical protein
MSIGLFLVVAALIITIISGIGRCPLWPAVLLLCVAMLIGVGPIRIG